MTRLIRRLCRYLSRRKCRRTIANVKFGLME